MPTAYPGDFDDFGVPSLPEQTPLSSAGDSTRAHTPLLRDLGDATEALQHNAALKGHDHSGDATDIGKGAKLNQANTHENSDVDTVNGMHHTLGTAAGQAAAGNHVHDYTSGTIVNKAIELCTSIARPEPFPGKLIWEVDTNRMRVWSQFPGQRTAVQGLYSIDKLERTNANDLGSTLWDQWYLIPTGAGKMATPDGHAAAWVRAGNVANRCIARRINSADSHTQGDDQVITFNTNASVADWVHANATNPTTNDAYFRMSDDGQTYVRAALTWWKGNTGSIMLVYTNSGPAGEELIGQLSAPTNRPNILWQLRLTGNKFDVYMGLEYMGAIIDDTDRVKTGFKGWGFGMQAGDGGAQQDLPNQISEVGIADATYFSTSPIWQLLPVGSMPKVALLTGRAQSINPTGSLVEWDEVVEDNFGFYRAEDPSTLVISEPGVYHLHASIIWGTNIRGDHAATVIMINGQATPHMHWEFVRGNNYVPGFSQTVDVSAFLRLDGGDRLAIAAAHNGASAQFTGHKRSSQITQLSRLFMTFHSA